MKCPYCFYIDSRVIDSRPTEEGEKIRRRRECLNCEKRFTTYEVIETTPVMVIKKDKSREVFDRAKLLGGLLRACANRPVSAQMLEDAVDDIQTNIQNTMDREVLSSRIGELAMKHLREIDEVAYVRFASVYREFKDLSSFMEELKSILEERSK
ncbi:MAG: transcriptional regulator NrdR [Oscillospiraceae bacterium]|jgi:transcriptional repressor NrdR|nr:transcriptional regulator NrdR [Oscillospiraceae bacterium]